MKILQFLKPSGKIRTIYVPSRKERKQLRGLLPTLNELVEQKVTKEVLHGFRAGRSPVTNAIEHVGRAYTVAFDLRDFFDTVTAEKLEAVIPESLMQQVLADGAARAGLPTSPAVANLAGTFMDYAILRWVRKHALYRTVYTRYADDLTISTDSEEVANEALRMIPQLVDLAGFTIAPEKTHLYRASAGRRIITGVAVDNDIHPTRRAKRRLRAARHQGNTPQAEGLREWCQLRLPRAARAEYYRKLQESTGRAMRSIDIPGVTDPNDEPFPDVQGVAQSNGGPPPDTPSVPAPQPRTRSIRL